MIRIPDGGRQPARAGAPPGPGTGRRAGPGRLVACLALLVAAVLQPPPEARAAAGGATLEQRVKAAFLYKFAGYVEWPEDAFAQPGAPFTIAVIGAEPLAAELTQAVRGRTVHDRSIAVKRLRSGEPLSGVHMLFVGADERERLTTLVGTTQDRPILTVTEFDGALEAGSVINFVVTEQRVRFEVSLGAAERSGLRLSSRLLAVAERVQRGDG